MLMGPAAGLTIELASDSSTEPSGFWGRAFRPFFLAAAIYAALAVPVWTGVWLGAASAPGWGPAPSSEDCC